MSAANVPAAALIPSGAHVVASWATATAAGEAIVVTWEGPGPDQFRQDRGVVLWRRFDDGAAPWRPVWGHAYHADRAPVLGISVRVADVTGDGSDDAIVLATTGGTGDCGIWLVLDLATGQRVYRSAGCDRRVDPSADPVGLTISEAIYAPGDPHCCPGSIRTTTLVYTSGSWQAATSTTSPA